jgi:hypothetical protein
MISTLLSGQEFAVNQYNFLQLSIEIKAKNITLKYWKLAVSIMSVWAHINTWTDQCAN